MSTEAEAQKLSEREVRNAHFVAQKYRKLIPYLPSDMIIWDQITDCQRQRSEQTTRIDTLRKSLVSQGIIDDEPARLYKDECLLQAGWSGVLDFSDKLSPEKRITKPSISWTCQPLECHIDSDLPVPMEKEKEAVREITMIPQCCVDIVHHHEDPIGPEAHLHVVCKGVHPSDLGTHINRLVREVLKFRGHEVE